MNFEFPPVLYEVPSDDELLRMFPDCASAIWIVRNAARKLVLRTRLSEAQNHRCAVCGVRTNNIPNHKRQATVEHVLAQIRGGKWIFEHCVMACARCNTMRQSKVIPEEIILCEELGLPRPQEPVALDSLTRRERREAKALHRQERREHRHNRLMSSFGAHMLAFEEAMASRNSKNKSGETHAA